MDGQWPQQQQQNSGLHADLDLSIASPGGDITQMLQDLGNDLDGMLGLGPNTNTTGNDTGGASESSAAAAEQDDSDGGSSQQRSLGRWNRKRHSRDQVYQLEVAYRENPHPDDNQRKDIAERLGITDAQVKFWFQNRRCSHKTHQQRQELRKLKQVKEELQAERRALRSATRNGRCLSCRDPTVRASSGEKRQLLSENASLRDKLHHVTAYLNRVSGGRASELIMAADMPSASSHGPANNHNAGVAGKGKAVMTAHAPPPQRAPVMLMAPDHGSSQHDTKAMLVDVADRATREFKALVYTGAPMWMSGPDGSEVDVLNFHSYVQTMFPSIFGPYRMGAVVDGTRKAGDVRCTAESLVGVLMDAAGWSGMFPGIVASATVSHALTPAGSRHGMTILMDAALRVLSPRVPMRRIKFVRQCRKEKPAGTWTVVDASVDGILGQDTAGCRLLPSGCLIQEMSNGGCKVTWIVNMEHDETTLSEMYHPLIRSGQALGACRWLASLQRQSEYLPIMHSLRNTEADMTPGRKMNVFEVAHQMTRSFCDAMCGPWKHPLRSVGKWTGSCGIGAERFEVVARVVTYSAGSGAPGAAVMSLTAPVWLPGIPAQQVFDYLCDVSRRREWDSLANGAPIHQEGHLATAQIPGNAVSVLRTMANGKLILQEACADATCMVLAYATTDEQRMQQAMYNGGAASLSLVPSGLVILPDGASQISEACTSSSTAVGHTSNTGSLITFMYQTLLNGQAPNEPSLEAIDDLGNLLCRLIRKIKDAVHANGVVAA